jgi:hypothetical protein
MRTDDETPTVTSSLLSLFSLPLILTAIQNMFMNRVLMTKGSVRTSFASLDTERAIQEGGTPEAEASGLATISEKSSEKLTLAQSER